MQVLRCPRQVPHDGCQWHSHVFLAGPTPDDGLLLPDRQWNGH